VHQLFFAIVACSPKVDPYAVRVSTARSGKETQDDDEAKEASHARKHFVLQLELNVELNNVAD